MAIVMAIPMEIIVEVVYASKDEQALLAVKLSPGSLAEDAIKASGILEKFPELNLAKIKIGVFSKSIALNYILQDGDRIEIYRPLTIDPKTARLLRARKS